eukprot:3938876-Rhodomonas_salina.3
MAARGDHLAPANDEEGLCAAKTAWGKFNCKTDWDAYSRGQSTFRSKTSSEWPQEAAECSRMSPPNCTPAAA